MSIKKLQSELRDYGFSEQESAIYLYLVRSVEASALSISRATDIPRTNVYKKCESLKRRGFLASSKKNNVLFYTPESFTTFRKKLDEKMIAANEIIPGLQEMARHASVVSPQAKIYQGKEGLKTVWESILETATKKKIKDFYGISHPNLAAILPKYFPRWVKKREALGIHLTLLFPKPESKKMSNFVASNKFRTTRFLPRHMLFSSNMIVYGDKVALFSLEASNIHAIIIESGPLVEMLRQFFLFGWNLAGAQG